MRITSRKPLRDFWQQRPDSKTQLTAWFAEAKRADWRSANEIKAQYKSASILKGGRVVFNICGNKYRIVVMINFESQIVYVRFVGTHSDYDKIDAEKV